MAFIKVQKLVRDDDGTIASGSAAIVDTEYVRNAPHHSRQVVRERLGRIVWLSEDRRTGVFLSPTRGLVEYDADADEFTLVDRDDPRTLHADAGACTPQHLQFGSAHLALEFLAQTGVAHALRTAFPDDAVYQYSLAHTVFEMTRDGSHETCYNMLTRTFAALALPQAPDSGLDCALLFDVAGTAQAKETFFKTLVATMFENVPGFGHAYLIDSVAFPNNEIGPSGKVDPSHAQDRPRVAFVIDEVTGIPIWYEMIPGGADADDVLTSVVSKVERSLGIDITSILIDARHCSKGLVSRLVGSGSRAFMYAPVHERPIDRALWRSVYDVAHDHNGLFTMGDSVFFGICQKTELAGLPVYAFVYIDKSRALKGFQLWLKDNEQTYRSMDQSQRAWQMNRFGCFILYSTVEGDPATVLRKYHGLADIGNELKVCNEYLRLLARSKQTEKTVMGKILVDTVKIMMSILLRRRLSESGIPVSELWGKARSLMCQTNRTGQVVVDTPTRKIREYYELLGVKVPAMVEVVKFDHDVLELEL